MRVVIKKCRMCPFRVLLGLRLVCCDHCDGVDGRMRSRRVACELLERRFWPARRTAKKYAVHVQDALPLTRMVEGRGREG